MATLKDIAERAEVSVGTVDRILHNRGRFSYETARKVRNIVRELDYQPNLMARQLSQARSCRIAAFLPFPDQDSGYWGLPLAGIRRAERDLAPFGLSLQLLHYNRYNPASFRRSGEQLLEGEYDGILMAPLLDEEARRFINKSIIADSIIFFDTDLPGARRLSYIGQDSYQSGRLGARLVNMLTKKTSHAKTRNIIVAPDLDNEHLNNRIRGFIENSAAEVETLRITVESDHNLAALHRLLGEHFDEHFYEQPGGSGIFVADASAHFIAEFLATARTPGSINAAKPALVGYDLVPENRRWIESGTIDFLLTQRPGEQGYNGINRLFRKLILDEDCPQHEYTPIDIVTQENLRYIIDEE